MCEITEARALWESVSKEGAMRLFVLMGAVGAVLKEYPGLRDTSETAHILSGSTPVGMVHTDSPQMQDLIKNWS
jgi:hypothetical protein